MADQVSLMASGGLSASRMRLLMNFLACGPKRPVVSRMKGARLMCGYLSNLLFSALLANCPGRVLAEVRGRAIEVEDKIHSRMFTLFVHDASKSRNLLFNEYFGAAV